MRFRDEPPVVQVLAGIVFIVVGALLLYLMKMHWNNPPTNVVAETPNKTITANAITGSTNAAAEDFMFETVRERIPLFPYGDRVITGKLIRNKYDGRCFILTWPVTGNPTLIPTACADQRPLEW